MRTTQQLSITLPNDMADVVKTKVKTGEYASESEVIRDGLRALLARDRAVDARLYELVCSHDRFSGWVRALHCNARQGKGQGFSG